MVLGVKSHLVASNDRQCSMEHPKRKGH